MEALVEAAKEPAAVCVQHFPNVWIVEVLRVPVQEAALRRLCLREMRHNRGEHDRIEATCHRRPLSESAAPKTYESRGITYAVLSIRSIVRRSPSRSRSALLVRTSARSLRLPETSRYGLDLASSRRCGSRSLLNLDRAFFVRKSVAGGSASENAGITN